MSNRAWVTLATNDSYSLGALVLVHSLRRVSSSYPAVVLITPSVTEPMRDRLRAVFSEVILVDVLDSKDAAHLALLQRPELGITFTKIHCWNLIQYEKCVFLDADALIVQNCDELFEREELSAAPDVGWPDCFNSGVFVFKPSADTFSKLIAFASERGSFDGGDQGLLNSYFSDWAHGDINKHLPFLYNVTSAAFYSYIPALKHYGQNLKIIHFIGANKPWLQNFNWQSRSVEAPEHLRGFLQLWWDLFVAQVHSRLDTQMDFTVHDRNYLAIPFIESSKSIHSHISVVSYLNNMCSKQQESCVEAVVEEVPLAIELEETTEYEELIKNYGFYEPMLDPSSEFSWHHPDNQTRDTEFSKPDIDMSQFHDPWHIYKGNIPPSNSRMEPIESQRQYAWDYTHPQEQHYTSGNTNNFEQSHRQYEQSSHNQNTNIWQYTPECISEPHNIQQFSYSGSSQHDETQQSTSSHNTEHHYTSIQEAIHQQDYQSHSYYQSSPESHNQQDQSHHDQYHNHHNHHHFDHHQNSNYENYSNSQHHEHPQHHYQNNCNQQGFETYRHEQNDNHNHQHLSKHEHLEPQHPHHHSNFEVQRQNVHSYQVTKNNQSSFYSHSQSNSIKNSKNVVNNEKINQNCRENVETSYRQYQRQKQSQHVYTVMMDHEKLHNIRIRNSYLNDCQMECHTAIEEIPRHPYDGFYLRHRATIDPRGRKICIHEIPLSVPSPTPSLESSADYDDAIDTFEEEINFERLNGHESYTGVAGNLAKVVPGAPQQQQAVDELTRRQGWEAGIIDYMGVDSFDNIWAKISQTLSQPPNSPPRQPSPPKEQSDQSSGAPVVEAEEVLVAPIETKPEDSAKGIAPSEDLPENPVAVEAPVVAPEVVAPNDVSVSTEKSENIAPIEAVETVAPTETIESVPEAPACVSSSEASDCVSPPEVLETVAQIAATETVPPSAASDCVSPPEVPETVAQIEALKSVSPSEASDCVSPPEVPETVAQIEAEESVSQTEALETVPPIEAEESVSQTEALETVAPIEAPSVSPPQASENVSPVTKEIVAIPEAVASVAPTEVTESVSSPDASISVAAVETIASPSAAIDPEPIETKEIVASPKTPAPAASVEEPVEDVPVPASEAAEISGKQEDSIPVPVEIAAVPVSAPAESNEGTESPDNIPVTAVEAIKIDNACSAKPSEIPASATEAKSQDETLIEKSLAVSESSIDTKEAISEPSPDKKEVASDSPPLANTPSKDEIPIAPAVKTEERRKPAGKLMLPPASCDTLPTPDSELEDAATLAHAIIAGELRTPTVTSPSPPVVPASSQAQPTQAPRGLSVDQPDVPTPPVESSQTSQSRIGVKFKPTIASQIETSVSKTEASPKSEASEAPKQKSDAPKKKIIKKVIKKVDKEGASSGDAPVPVPPPRKKEKKPKEK